MHKAAQFTEGSQALAELWGEPRAGLAGGCELGLRGKAGERMFRSCWKSCR